MKEYLRTSRISSQPRGHINISASLQSCWGRGQNHKASVERFEQTADIPANRLIKHALEFGLSALARAGHEQQLITLANDVHRELPSEIQRYRSSDYRRCLAMVRGQYLPASRAYYYRALEIALLILSQRAVTLDHMGEDVALPPFILDFEDVFERYLRRVLELHAPENVIVRDGNHDGKKPLYDDRHDPPAQPDIVLEAHSRAPIIAEVKYKEKPDRADINQAVTYAVSYRTDAVVLVHQSRTTGPKGIYEIGIMNNIRVRGFGFDLAAKDLAAEELAFSQALQGLIPNAPALTLVA